MNKILLLLVLVSGQVCKAQHDYQIRVVMLSGNVSVDGTPVTSGQIIASPSRKLVIAKKDSYAYVLTQEGHTMKLEAGTFDIKNLDRFIYNERYKPSHPPAGVIGTTPVLTFIGIDHFGTNLLMGDSIYLKWKKNHPSIPDKLPHRLKILSMFGDILYEADVNDNTAKLNLRKIAGENTSIIVSLPETESTIIKLLPAESLKEITNELSQIKSEQIHKEILGLIIYDSNMLIADTMFKLNNMASIDLSLLDPDLKNYVTLLKERFEFD